MYFRKDEKVFVHLSRNDQVQVARRLKFISTCR